MGSFDGDNAMYLGLNLVRLHGVLAQLKFNPILIYFYWSLQDFWIQIGEDRDNNTWATFSYQIFRKKTYAWQL